MMDHEIIIPFVIDNTPKIEIRSILSIRQCFLFLRCQTRVIIFSKEVERCVLFCHPTKL
jgi:hypothetical protein